MKRCLYCNESVKNKYCNVSCQNRHLNPLRKQPPKRVERKCEKCYSEFIQIIGINGYECKKCDSCRTPKPVIKTKCLQCGNEVLNGKFCSLNCSATYQQKIKYELYIKDWKQEKNNGSKGVLETNISAPVRRYILNKFENKCVECGWSKKHPKTKTFPLHIDHIDGDHRNNKENNLRLLCPNCHCLTDNYGSLNIGRGRKRKTIYG